MKWVLFVIGIFVEFGAVASAHFDTPGTVLIAFVGGVFLAFSMLGQLQEVSLSGDGLKATAREARQLAAEAKDTLTNVRGLMVALGKFLVWQKAGEGRFGGPGAAAAETAERLLRQISDAAGLTEADYEEIRSAEHPFIRFDYEHYVTDAAATGKSWTPEQHAAWNAHFTGPARRGPGSEDNPTELRAFLARHGFIDAEVEERLRDYEYWEKNKQHRREKEWRKHFKMD